MLRMDRDVLKNYWIGSLKSPYSTCCVTTRHDTSRDDTSWRGCRACHACRAVLVLIWQTTKLQ